MVFGIDRNCECDSENERVCLGLDDGRASEAATWWWCWWCGRCWLYGGVGERVTKRARLGTGEMVTLSLTGT